MTRRCCSRNWRSDAGTVLHRADRASSKQNGCVRSVIVRELYLQADLMACLRSSNAPAASLHPG